MAFIQRNTLGIVTGLFGVRQHEGQEELPEDHPEVAEFRAKHPVSPEMLRPLSDQQRKALRERSARLDAEHVRIRDATLAFQRKFVELETALSCLLHAILGLRKSHMAYAIYYSIPGYRGRLLMVGNALEQHIREAKGIDTELRAAWATFVNQCRLSGEVRNTIAHGAPLTINGMHARFTSPPFDVLKVGWPMSNGSVPGYSADNLEQRLRTLSALALCADDFNRYVCSFRDGDGTSPDKYRELVEHMSQFDNPNPNAQKKPKQKAQPRPSPASRRKQALARHAKAKAKP